MANRKRQDPGPGEREASTATLPVQEIRSNTWVPFFNDLNNRHHGRRVDIDKIGAGGGAPQTEMRQRRLQSISSMLGRPGEPDAISITVSEDDQRMANRTISEVKNVRFYTTGGEDEKLEIEASSGEKTIVVFKR